MHPVPQSAKPAPTHHSRVWVLGWVAGVGSLQAAEYLIIYTEADEFYLITSTWNIIVIDNTDFKLLTWVKIESLILNQNWIKIYFK